MSNSNISNDWIAEMSDAINGMKNGFVTKLKDQVNEEQASLNDSELAPGDSLDAENMRQEVMGMLDNVDKQTQEFNDSLIQGIMEIVDTYANDKSSK